MNAYPKVLGEEATLAAAAAGASLARYGDGEFKLALGHDNISQMASKELAADLRRILVEPRAGLLVAIPNIRRNAKPDSWANYGATKYCDLLSPKMAYGSAFITRPDSAPWIDTPDYWDSVRALWAGKDVTLVTGSRVERSLHPGMMPEAAAVRLVVDEASHRDAYERIDQIEEQIGTPAGPVLMCLGACATVLAARLAAKGVHALDLGHIGMFLRHAGAYRYAIDELASHGYRQQLKRMHRQRWGGDGAKHLDAVLRYADEIAAETVLDYGCGEGKLAEAAKPVRRILNYDPGVEGRDGLPKPVDLLVSTDVLEHVEPDKLDAVLAHMRYLAAKAAYVVIATREANAKLPDGRNAHLCVRPAEWWVDKLLAAGWDVERAEPNGKKDVALWLRPRVEAHARAA